MSRSSVGVVLGFALVVALPVGPAQGQTPPSRDQRVFAKQLIAAARTVIGQPADLVMIEATGMGTDGRIDLGGNGTLCYRFLLARRSPGADGRLPAGSYRDVSFSRASPSGAVSQPDVTSTVPLIDEARLLDSEALARAATAAGVLFPCRMVVWTSHSQSFVIASFGEAGGPPPRTFDAYTGEPREQRIR